MPNEAEYVLSAVTDTLKSTLWCVIGFMALMHLCWAVSLHMIAKRRELKHRWIAWIPVLNMWLLGSIADQYRYVVRGEVSCKRGGLLFAVLLEKAVVCLILAALVIQTQKLAAAVGDGVPMLGLIWIPAKNLKANLSLLFCYLLSSMMLWESRTEVLYDVFRSCAPDGAVVHTVLSALPVLGVIFRPVRLRLCRDGDFGMPPRWDELEELDYEEE